MNIGFKTVCPFLVNGRRQMQYATQHTIVVEHSRNGKRFFNLFSFRMKSKCPSHSKTSCKQSFKENCNSMS